MKPTRIYIGIFKKGKLITKIGNSVQLPDKPDPRAATIAVIDVLTGKIAEQYSPIGGEYVAYDYLD